MFGRADAPIPTPAPPRVGPRYLGLEAREWAIVGLAIGAGIVFGVFIHFVDSLATDVAYLADLVRAIAYVVAFVAFMIGIAQLTTGRRSLLLAVIPFVGAAVIASGFGPTVAPPALVVGSVDLSVDGTPADGGQATCVWAAGRDKVERVTDKGTLGQGRAYTIDVDRGRLRISLEVDGGQYIALGAEPFAAISGPAQHATMHLPLFQANPQAPEDIPGAVEASIDWSCEAAPPS